MATKGFKMRMAGYMERLGKSKLHNSLVRKPEGNTPCGKFGGRLKLNVKKNVKEIMCAVVDWINVAEYMDY